MVNLKNPKDVKSFYDFEKLLQRNIIVFLFLKAADFLKIIQKLLNILSMIFDTYSLKIEKINNQK